MPTDVDWNWVQVVAGLVLGFLVKVLLDELRSPRLKILRVSRQPFTISPEIQVIGTGFDNHYTAYRIRVENKQKPFLNCAAENCVAWLELENAPEPYQICWVGNCSDVTINVGDVREIDFIARGNATGAIYAPTERGYFEPSPRIIGDGKSELRGKVRITSKNGKRAESRFVIKPPDNQLEITLLDGNSVGSRANTGTDTSKTQSFKPLPWGTLFFSFWMTLRIVDSPAPLMNAITWFFLVLSGILLLSVFAQPLFPYLQKVMARRSPFFIKFVNRQNVSWFFTLLVFFTTLIGFPTNIITNWSQLTVIDVSISVVGLVLWMIAYLLVLVGITSQTKGGQIMGGVISALIIWSAINSFKSNVLAGWILIGIAVVSIIIAIFRPKVWDFWQIV